MSRRSFDVAVLGAGPAGSTAAALLAGAGLDVVVIDKEEFPRDKVCGEFLSYDALPLLEPLGVVAELDRLGAPTIDVCRIVTRRGSSEFDLPTPARGISRWQFDETLLRTAGKCGAEIMEGWTAAETVMNGESFSVEAFHRNRGTVQIDARAIIGSWGRWGRIDQQIGRHFVSDQSHRHFGFKRHYKALVATPSNRIDLYPFRRGYLGVSAIEDGLTNICGLVHRSRIKQMRSGWDGFVDDISSEEDSLATLFSSHAPAQENFLSSEPVIFRARRCVENGILMIGDAAGLIDPLAGNGMAMAIQSAWVAATHLLPFLRGGADRSATEAAYSASYASTFARRIGWSRTAAFFLSKPRLLSYALGITSSMPVGPLFLRKTRAGNAHVEEIARGWERVAQRGR